MNYDLYSILILMEIYFRDIFLKFLSMDPCMEPFSWEFIYNSFCTPLIEYIYGTEIYDP